MKVSGIYQIQSKVHPERIYIGSSVLEAAKAIGKARNTLSSCVTGKKKSAGGFIWRYKTECNKAA
jgi:hypothetical protein